MNTPIKKILYTFNIVKISGLGCLVVFLIFITASTVKAQTSASLSENAGLESLATRSPLIRQILLQILNNRQNSSRPVQSVVFNPTNLDIPALTTNLESGSTGIQVQNLQKFLNVKGYNVTALGQETTTFGPVTQAALRRYQAANNLPQTGRLDAPTRTTINLSVYRPTTNVPSTSTALGTATEFTLPAGFISQPTRSPNLIEVNRWQQYGLPTPARSNQSSLFPNGSAGGAGSLSPGNQNASLGAGINSPDAFSTLLGVAGSVAISRSVRPFGGSISSSTICTCTPGVRIELTNGETLMYLPVVSDINAYFNIFIPRVQLLGTSLPFRVPCLQGLGFAGIGSCTDTGLSGNLIRVVGTSL